LTNLFCERFEVKLEELFNFRTKTANHLWRSTQISIALYWNQTNCVLWEESGRSLKGVLDSWLGLIIVLTIDTPISRE
jgi:hypothetical protein